MAILYPRRSGTGNAVTGKEVPEYLVEKFLKQGFSRTPDITNEKAAEAFFNQKLELAQTELRSEAQKLTDERAEFERMKAEFLTGKTIEQPAKIDGRTKQAKSV